MLMTTISMVHDFALLGSLLSEAPSLETTGQSLTPGQFSLVYNALSLSIAAMFASALFFLSARAQVGQKYQIALLVSAIVVSIAGYHYFRIFNSWGASFSLQNGVYMPTGEPFNDAYRYVDWLLTVPLLLVETVAVLALPAKEAKPLLIKLALASVVMIAAGYPGEISTDSTTRLVWGAISTVPFAYILYVLWVELSRSLVRQPAAVQTLVRNMRLLLLFSWGAYPIAYLLPLVGVVGASGTVGIQVGYTVADILAKPVFGLLVFAIAVTKTEADRNDGLSAEVGRAPELDATIGKPAQS